ncbi:Uncharacterised protein [Streptococcus pseudoporcinus]|uniref:Uncharacterized protein n=1 Tax=Streptococcus pseudoporcinus TaxID=361101 RepID=A0A4U9YT39_9STRE|nr:hypothetical protein [Streptococcus pseudoporcinus]VTS29922.1 Uncharacterised protein [Streptococcus pseudoporcinus]
MNILEEKIKVFESPYRVVRICNTSQNMCKDNMLDIISKQNEIDKLELFLNDELKKLEEQLYAEIGEMSEKDSKNGIKLKRNILNKKFSSALNKSISLFSESCRDRILYCNKVYEEILLKQEEQHEILNQNIQESFNFLKYELNNNVSFANALAMSVYNSDLYRNILDIKMRDDIILNKKTRNTLFSLRNYHNRMTQKPSPFSTFVSTKMILIDDKQSYFNTINKEDNRDKDNFHQTSKVYINDVIPKTIENMFLQDNIFMKCFFVKINPTLRIYDTYYEYLNVDLTYYVENILKIKRTSEVDLILSILLKKGNVPIFEFAEYLIKNYKNNFGDIDEIIILLLKLDKLGIIYKNFAISHLDYNTLHKLYKLCNYVGNEKYNEISKSIKFIIDSVDSINRNEKMEINRKYDLKNGILCEVKKIFSYFPKIEVDLNFIKKNILYENNTFPCLNYSKSLPDKTIKYFYYAEKLYRLFDNNYVQRIVFRNIFLKNNSIGDKVNIMDFYKQVGHEYKNSIDSLVMHDKDIKLISRLQARVFEYINKTLRKNNSDVINISIKLIEDICSEFPKILTDKMSYGIYYQNDNKNIVVNNVAPGMGRHVVRYVNDLRTEDKEEFMFRYKKHIEVLENRNIRFTDIGTTLGLNINKHVEALNYAFSYPKSVYNKEVSLHDLNIIFDCETESVKITDNNNNFYDSTPIGFLFPRISPSFYSFLSTFSNSRGSSISFWDRYHTQFEVENLDVEHYPRIMLESEIIIDRETWKIKKNYFDNNSFTTTDKYSDYILFYRCLCENNGVPNKFFAKKSNDIDAIQQTGEEMKEWEKIIINNKLRKPQYYDLNNYLDYSILKSLIRNYSDLTLTIQEVFPNKMLGVEEYLVELNERKEK